MRACNDEMVKLELLMKINMRYAGVTIKDEGVYLNYNGNFKTEYLG